VRGLYVQPDTGTFYAIDHITVKKNLPAKSGALKLELANPTEYDADVKVLCEFPAACARHWN
jgi:hypothetical protein